MTKKIIRSFPKVVCSNISTKGTLSGFTSRFVTKSAAKGGNNRFLDPSFEGKSGQVAIDFARRTMAVGVGKGNIAEYQQATRTIVTTARDKKIAAVNIQLPKKMYASFVEEPSAASLVLSSDTIGAPTIAQTVSAAAVMASYHYGRTKTSPAPAAPKLVLTGNNNEAASEIDAGTIVGNAVNDARTLGNLRPDEGSPQFYEQWMRKHIATLPGVSIRHVIRGEHLKRQGLNLMHAVGRSAVREPVLVVLEYRGDKKSKTSTALVGKGLTFDCGGMNVKPYGSMESMHQDMMGAAAVMATLRAAARLKLRTNIVAVAAFAENAIGPDAYLPSTIIKSLNGKSVEILNTDAEGRLVLADALTFLQRNANLKTKPNVIIDLATLTGAIMIGLGNDRAGLFSNDARLARRLMTSSVRTNEKLWPMPIGAEHTKAMKGGIADLVNAAEGRSGGSCTAAAFLQEFIEGDVRWAHLDIAGTGMGKDKATAAAPAGAPGFGVRLLIDYLRNVSK